MKLFLVVLAAARPKFLMLSVAMVCLAVAIAFYQGYPVSVSLLWLTLLAAVGAHAAVNWLNEYEDLRSGLDTLTIKTPFSGGSGALPKAPYAAQAVLRSFQVTVALLVGLGVAMTFWVGWQILPIGLLGLGLILFYTRFITRMPWLCLVAPGFGFGVLMVLGSFYVFSGTVTSLALVLSMVPFFLVNNLLLLNQIPDLSADQKVGRFNIHMLMGLKASAKIFTLFNLGALFSLVLAIEHYQLPASMYVALFAFILILPLVYSVQKNSSRPEKLMSALTMNVIINIVMPMLIALMLVIGS